MSKLYIIPTPIGNMEDITLRAIRVLKEVDIILAEDTRTSSKLLKHLGIDKKVYAHHQHNERKSSDEVIKQLQSGVVFGLISDAGTPAISDPGFYLTRECVKEGIEVECLPGATAFVPALVNSGLPCDRFVFEGFLPHKKGRQTRILDLKEETKTMIFYESPHRIKKTLDQLKELWEEDREASISRELTKLHEETLRGTLSSLSDHFDKHAPKGEFVLIVKGKES